MEDDCYIKEEDGKEVVYKKGLFGFDSKVGELHEKWDGSKETRNFFGPNVKVEKETFWTEVSGERKASVDGEEGVFSRDKFLGVELRNSPSFKSHQKESDSETLTDRVDSSTDYSYPSDTSTYQHDKSKRKDKTGLEGYGWTIFFELFADIASFLKWNKIKTTLYNLPKSPPTFSLTLGSKQKYPTVIISLSLIGSNLFNIST